MATKWREVKPVSTSNPAYFSGDQREEILKKYGKRTVLPVLPTSDSDFHNYMNEQGWTGISDFYKKRTKVAETYKSLENLIGKEKPMPQVPGQPKINIVTKGFDKNDPANQYPNNSKYYYTTEIEIIDLDKERMNDIGLGKCIKIDKPQGVKKDIKEPNSIYSPLFGPTFDDISSYGNRYSCACGETRSQQNEGTICPICGKPVTYKGDDFKIFGWIILDDDVVIHQGLYPMIEFFIGRRYLNNMIDVKDDKDENGFSLVVDHGKDEPFADCGMLGFYQHFDEIMEFYRKKNPLKEEYYQFIMKHRDKVFTHSIPVYTTLLRPYQLKDGVFAFQDTNENFNIMAMLGYLLNNKLSIKGRKSKKTRNQLLYDMQYNLNEVYKEVIKIMSSKKGVIRNLYGGRCNFTCRSVIVQNWKLRTDQITLPYHALVRLLEQSIINILHRSYGMSMHQARMVWDKANDNYDKRVHKIINYIIEAHPEGIPVLINRNPEHNAGLYEVTHIENFVNCWELSKETISSQAS